MPRRVCFGAANLTQRAPRRACFEAANQIRGFSGVRSSYANAIKLLKQYYADEDRVRVELTKQLVTLKSPKCTSEELLPFQSSYSTILMQLQSLVEDYDKWIWMAQDACNIHQVLV